LKVVVQRVTAATVHVGDDIVSCIGRGLLVLVGIGHDDGEEQARWIAGKIVGLRVFEDTDGRLNRSVVDIGGEVLIVSQFTLLGDCSKGRRPSFVDAARPQVASPLVQRLAALVAELGIPAQQGVFGAHMRVELVNDGPVTLVIETP
jgi:D-tyrosyl-tRNA(Tyr) deacylase